MTASRALQIIGAGISQKLSAVYVGRAFCELGFRKVRVNHCWGYRKYPLNSVLQISK